MMKHLDKCALAHQLVGDQARNFDLESSSDRQALAATQAASYAWRQDFIETFLSRDASRFGITLPPEGLRRYDLDDKVTALPLADLAGELSDL